MRPGSVFASVCFLLLASMKFTEQSYVLASFLVLASLAFLVVGLGLPRRGSRNPSIAPSSTEVREAQQAHYRNARGWRYIGLGGLLVSVGGVFIFPPMSLVIAGLSLYSIYRMRKSLQSAERLGLAMPQGFKPAN